jgi:hypothetical protein
MHTHPGPTGSEEQCAYKYGTFVIWNYKTDCMIRDYHRLIITWFWIWLWTRRCQQDTSFRAGHLHFDFGIPYTHLDWRRIVHAHFEHLDIGNQATSSTDCTCASHSNWVNVDNLRQDRNPMFDSGLQRFLTQYIWLWIATIWNQSSRHP